MYSRFRIESVTRRHVKLTKTGGLCEVTNSGLPFSFYLLCHMRCDSLGDSLGGVCVDVV